MSDIDIIWQPNAGSQVKAITCPVFEVLMHGNRGGGKTDWLLMDYAQHVGQGYGEAWRGIIFRQTYKQLQDVIAKSRKWFHKIWPHAQYNTSEHYWHWPTGEHLYFRQFMRDDDYWNYHGHEYPFIGWEELCNWHSLSGYKRMISCSRSPHADMPRKLRATTNPYGPGHNVVKFRFKLPLFTDIIIKDAKDEEGNEEPYRIAIKSMLSENRALDTDPDYRKRILAAARNKEERKAWDEGDWNIVAGGMFDDVWDPKHHVIKPFNIPPTWRVDRSFDWGSSAPYSVGWWAESDGSDVTLRNGNSISTVRGDLFRINEIYGWNGKPNEGTNLIAQEIAELIVKKEIDMGYRRTHDFCRVKAGPADTQIWINENGSCIADDFAAKVRVEGYKKLYKGVSWSRADKSPGTRKTGWQAVRTRLRNGIRKKKKPREKPGLFIFDNCEQFIRTVPVLSRDDKDLDDIANGLEDHIGDETRYRIREISKRAKSGTTTGHY